MKTIIFTLGFLAVITCSYSQLITISETHQMPVPGDSVHYQDANTFGFDADGVGPVTDVVWDFGALMNESTSVTFSYVDATTTAQTGEFPNANIARENSEEAGYFYYECDGYDWKRWGWYAGTTNWGKYDSGAVEFHFPISAGDSYNSEYHGDYAPFGLGEDSVVIDMGQIIAQADMQGTLTLPTGTFNNVLRIHLVESFHIKSYFMGTPATDNLVEDDYYYWFHDTILQPILVYGITSLDGSQQSEVLRYQPINVATGSETRVLTECDDIVYPNPTSGIININNDKYNFVKVFNMKGEQVDMMTIKSSIDLSHLPNGTYILKLSGKEGSTVVRIILDK